jgi:hypothetical protein
MTAGMTIVEITVTCGHDPLHPANLDELSDAVADAVAAGEPVEIAGDPASPLRRARPPRHPDLPRF